MKTTSKTTLKVQNVSSADSREMVADARAWLRENGLRPSRKMVARVLKESFGVTAT